MLAIAWHKESLMTLAQGTPSWVTHLFVIILTLIAGRLTYSRWGTAIRYSAYYPPIWVGVLVGVAVALVLSGVIPAVHQTFGLPVQSVTLAVHAGALLLVVIAIIATESLIAVWRRVDPTPFLLHDGGSTTTTGPRQSFDRDVWLQTDDAIERCEHDIFDRARIARRVAKRLCLPGSPAQAVVGALGSGKTTLRNFVSEELLRISGGPRLVPVEVWPFETSRAAVEGVLSALIDALSCDVSVLALRGVPGRYAQAMHASGGVIAGLARLLGSPGSPHDTLLRIDKVALAAGRKYVVWIEDLERFAANHGDFSVGESEKMNPIRALLVGLDRLESVTVVTSTTSLQTRFDVEKIARYVEILPPLDSVTVRPILSKFRADCWSAGVLDPAEPSAREALSKLGRASRTPLMFGTSEPDSLGVGDAITELCATPRALKTALRTTDEAWSLLRGEIDLDDLLVMNILRAGDPDAFALVTKYVDDLRLIHDSSYHRREQQAAAVDRWRRSVERLDCSEQRKRAVRGVSGFIFGKSHEKPQGVAGVRHVDYWQRFLAEPELGEHERDQPVLCAIERGGDDILNILDDPQRAAALRTFYSSIAVWQIVALFGPYIQRVLHIIPVETDDSRLRGLWVLCDIWVELGRRGSLPVADADDQLFISLWRCAAVNPGLACAIEYHFVSRDGEYDLLGSERAMYLERHLRDCFFGQLVGRPGVLAESLRGQQSPTLLWLAWGLERVRANDTDGDPFKEWPGFAMSLLEAAVLDPESVIPQLAHLVVELKSNSRTSTGRMIEFYDFSAVKAEALFGSADCLLSLFSPHSPSLWPGDKAVQGVYQAMGNP